MRSEIVVFDLFLNVRGVFQTLLFPGKFSFFFTFRDDLFECLSGSQSARKIHATSSTFSNAWWAWTWCVLFREMIKPYYTILQRFPSPNGPDSRTLGLVYMVVLRILALLRLFHLKINQRQFQDHTEEYIAIACDMTLFWKNSFVVFYLHLHHRLPRLPFFLKILRKGEIFNIVQQIKV